MDKITIVGISGAGKTCYTIGMLSRMMMGLNGFTLTPDNGFAKFKAHISKLANNSLPAEQRFPPATSMAEEYKFSLKYNMREINQFEWIDYPGDYIEMDENEANQQFFEHLKDTDCLFICVNGEAFSDPDPVYRISFTDGGLALNNVLQKAVEKNKRLPPACIIITKYDKVNPEYRKSSNPFILDVLSKVFPILIKPPKKENNNQNNTQDGIGYTRIVTIVPVSLGKDIDKGGRLEPYNVHLPIAFATVLTTISKLIALESKISELQDQYNEQSQGLFNKVFKKGAANLTAGEIEAYKSLGGQFLNNLNALKSEIKNLPLYINCEKTEWTDILP
jgi:hypothetical protein